MREQHSEFREDAAKNYATKSEMMELERRSQQGINRVVEQLDKLNARLETIGDTIIKTLAGR